MRHRFFAGWALVIALVLSMLPATSGGVVAAQDGLDDDGYESPQFGYSVTWDDDWEARPRDVISNPGGYDTLTLRGPHGTLWIQGQGDRTTAADAVQHRIGIEGSEEDVTASDLEAEVPVVEMLVGRNKVLIEGYTLEDNDAVIVIVLSARERDFDDALASVHDQVLFNGDQILTGVEPRDGGTDGHEITGTPMEEVIEEPAEQPTEDVVKESTEEPTGEATVKVGDESTPEDESVLGTEASGVDGTTYTSPLYAYSFEWDENEWKITEEILTDVSDGLVMMAETGALTIWSWNIYDDPVSCLDGESDYYGFEDPTVSNWEPALDEDGEPIRAEGDDYAWGVFTLTYTDVDDPNADPVELVDYIECRAIPGTDATVIILGAASPELYNDHLDVILDVTDTLTFAAAGESTNVPEPDSTPVEPDNEVTGLDGSLFTSPSFGFRVNIPAEWRVVDEVLDSDNEVLVLTNGTSDVTIRATGTPADDLAGCVDFAADESGYDLELDTNAAGEPFRGADRNGAYANFVYDDENGNTQSYFVSCQYIEEDASVFILTHDLDYDDIGTERKFRRDLQTGIELP